jgi:AcrR family transcriptional regulator
MARARSRAATAAYHHGDLRRALLDGARAVLREQGPEGCSLREVARRAGVSHAAPYHHFPSREALLGALAEEAFAEMDRGMSEAQAAAPEEPEAQLVAVGMGYLLYALREPAAFRLMTRPEYLAPRREAPASAASAAPVAPVGDPTCLGPYGRLLAALARLAGRPLAPAELTRDAHLCWGAVHGLAVLALDGGLDVAPGALAGHLRAAIGRLAGALRAAR